MYICLAPVFVLCTCFKRFFTNKTVEEKGTRLFRRVSEVLLCFPSVGSEAELQTQLIECQAQLEHWQGVARICEFSKQEELQELQKQCDQEIQSLQEALRGEEGERERGREGLKECGHLRWR